MPGSQGHTVVGATTIQQGRHQCPRTHPPAPWPAQPPPCRPPASRRPGPAIAPAPPDLLKRRLGLAAARDCRLQSSPLRRCRRRQRGRCSRPALGGRRDLGHQPLVCLTLKHSLMLGMPRLLASSAIARSCARAHRYGRGGLRSQNRPRACRCSRLHPRREGQTTDPARGGRRCALANPRSPAGRSRHPRAVDRGTLSGFSSSIMYLSMTVAINDSSLLLNRRRSADESALSSVISVTSLVQRRERLGHRRRGRHRPIEVRNPRHRWGRR